MNKTGTMNGILEKPLIYNSTTVKVVEFNSKGTVKDVSTIKKTDKVVFQHSINLIVNMGFNVDTTIYKSNVGLYGSLYGTYVCRTTIEGYVIDATIDRPYYRDLFISPWVQGVSSSSSILKDFGVVLKIPAGQTKATATTKSSPIVPGETTTSISQSSTYDASGWYANGGYYLLDGEQNDASVVDARQVLYTYKENQTSSTSISYSTSFSCTGIYCPTGYTSGCDSSYKTSKSAVEVPVVQSVSTAPAPVQPTSSQKWSISIQGCDACYGNNTTQSVADCVGTFKVYSSTCPSGYSVSSQDKKDAQAAIDAGKGSPNINGGCGNDYGKSSYVAI